MRATRDILGWKEITARMIELEAIVLGEYHENELLCKAFTISERVAIGQALEKRLGNRQGQQTDRGLVENSPQVERRQRTDRAFPGNGPEVEPGQRTSAEVPKGGKKWDLSFS